MKNSPRFIAVFPEIPQVSQYMTNCEVVITKMTDNANVPDPTPTLAQVSAHLATLKECEELAHQGGMGAIDQRDVALMVVRADMRLLKAYVQNRADANLAESKSIITSSGMGVGKKKAKGKAHVAVKDGKTPGSVVLDCKALRRPVVYRWQMSTNQEAWSDLEESFKASLTVEGLTPATIYYFRLRTMTRNGLSDWSVVVSIIVR